MKTEDYLAALDEVRAERDRYREALEDIAGSIPANWQHGNADQQAVYDAIQRGLYGREPS